MAVGHDFEVSSFPVDSTHQYLMQGSRSRYLPLRLAPLVQSLCEMLHLTAHMRLCTGSQPVIQTAARVHCYCDLPHPSVLQDSPSTRAPATTLASMSSCLSSCSTAHHNINIQCPQLGNEIAGYNRWAGSE